ncbi:MAG: TonB-dependent receptor [Inhella sp.]
MRLRALLLVLPTLVQAQESAELDRVTITVVRGQLRSVHGLERSEFAQAIPGTSPLASMARLPGAYFQAADSLGNYEGSARFALRGFSQSQLGFTLDDVPLGDMSYGNHNGLHISRAIASENLARASLSQGTGALDTASTSNLGGTVQFYSLDPAPEARVQARLSLGSDQRQRLHLRADTGQFAWGALGLSLTEHREDKWKAQGRQRQRQWNLKWLKEGPQWRASAFLNSSDRREMDYQDFSLDMLRRLGPDWDNSYPNLDAALRASRELCGNGGKPYVTQCDDAYFAGSGLRKDKLGGINLEWRPAPNWLLRQVAYGHRNEGAGLWFTPYTPSPDGTPLALRTTEYRISRRGWLGSLDWEAAAHQWRASLWLERNHFDHARRFYAVSPAALPDPYQFPRNAFRTDWDFDFDTDTLQYSLADTWSLAPNWSLGLGFKGMRVVTDAALATGSDRPVGRVVSDRPFLPQAGLVHTLSPTDELFVSFARNARAFQAAAAGTTPFATTAAGFQAIKDRLHPESSDNWELGWRRHGQRHQASLVLYRVHFRDRLLSVQAGSAIQGNPSVLSNVGDVRGSGLEAALSARLSGQWSAYASLSLARARYLDDVISGSTRVPTQGKRVVDSPERMLKAGLGYQQGPVSLNLGLDAISRRYYSYTNDASVPGQALWHAQAAYRFGTVGALQGVRLSLAVQNLGNRRGIATLGSNGFVNNDALGQAQTLLPGAPRQLSLGLEGSF